MRKRAALALMVVLSMVGSGCSVVQVQAWFGLHFGQSPSVEDATRIADEANKSIVAGCDGNYSGVCVPDNRSDIDCVGSGDGPYWISGPLTVVGWDHYGLDPDGDKTACEVQPPPPPPPPPPSSSTQPLLVVTSSGNPFTTFVEEMLKAEGLSFVSKDLASIDATTLSQFDAAVLGAMSLTTAQVNMFSAWVNAGGGLVALRPDRKLAPLLGLSDASSTVSNTWLRIDTGSAAGSGLVGETIQWHGTADRYTLSGATALATLYSTANSGSATPNPAATRRAVGSNGGSAGAFTFDLARSVVLTRQGNPDWVGRNVDGLDGYEASEMFFGANGAPDWNDLDKALIPIADEQQRLFANMVTLAVGAHKPLPRFWYLPRSLKAAVVMTGDDHATGGTESRFDDFLAASPNGCNVANWECVRASSYLFPFQNGSYTQMSNAQAVSYQNQGFEIGVHITTNCSPWGTTQDLFNIYDFQMNQFRAYMPGLAAPDSTRTHCVEWDDWATAAKVKLANGIRLDTDYYYYPGTWTQGRPGYFNGTALPMRYADEDGTPIDVYQATTQVTDESGLDSVGAVSIMLDNALGSPGYYSVVTVNEHTDSTCGTCVYESAGIVAAAQNRGVPVVSGRQMLHWLDARNNSDHSNVTWNGSSLTYTVTGGATGLTGMLPLDSSSGTLNSIRRGGTNVSFTTATIKGIRYALYNAGTGNYTATYG